jgi:hypothetical protein
MAFGFSQKHKLKFESQVPAILGKRVFADVTELRGGHSGGGWALSPVPGVLRR